MTDNERTESREVANPFGSAPVAAAPTGALATAAAAREVAEVQAAMVIAKKFPRDPIAAMDRILQSCARPSLANAALYQYSRGGQDISGPSIRLAEELARGWGNIVCGVTELTRSGGVSECLAYAWDLETNFRDEKRFQVKHWRDTKSGGYALKDERDIYEAIANQGARRKRACLLAVIPADVQEAAVEQCDVALRADVDTSPERIKAMVDAFAQFGVTQAQIEKRMQRRLDAMTPALMLQFRRIFNSLRDGMSSAGDWFESDAQADESTDVPTKGVEGAKAALRRGRAQKSRDAAPPSDPPPSSEQPAQREQSVEEKQEALDLQRDMPV